MGNFKETQLGSIGQFSKGSGISKDSVVDDGEYNAIRYAELYTTYGIIIKDIMSHVNHKDIKSSKQIQYGDILIAGSGEELIDIGKTAVYSLNEPCYVGGDTVIFRPDKNQNGIYLGYLLNTQKVIKQRMKYGQGNSIVHIYTRDLQKIKISIPSLEEQKAIVSVLEKWDKFIELLDQKIQTKKNIKKYLQQVLLTGKVRLRGFGGEWQEYILSELGKVYSGLKGKSKDDFGEGKKYISYMNVYSNPRINLNIKEFVNVKEGESQNAVRYGDVFFTTSSETPDEVAISSVLLDNNKGDIYLNSFCFGYRLNNFDILSPEFSQFYFRSSIFRKQMNRIAQGAIRYNLSKRYFLEERVRLPNIQEQKAISSILSKSDEEIVMLEKQKGIIEEQRKYLLNNLVTGEIRLPKFRNNK